MKDGGAVLPDYLAAALRSRLTLAQTVHMMTGNTHPRLTDGDVRALPILVGRWGRGCAPSRLRVGVFLGLLREKAGSTAFSGFPPPPTRAGRRAWKLSVSLRAPRSATIGAPL